MSTSGADSLTVETASTPETIGLATWLGRALTGGEFLALCGDLGAGKTHFVKGLAAGLDIDPSTVTSPTFLLIHELDGRLPLVHMDAYRVRSAEELAEAGGADLLDGRRVLAVEWAENAADFVPEDALAVRILVTGEQSRSLEFRAGGPRSRELLARLRGRFGEGRP